MVGEDPYAYVREQRAVDGALHVLLVGALVPDPDEAREVLDVAAAHQEDAGAGEDGDRADRERAWEGKAAYASCNRQRGDRGEGDPDRTCEGTREDEPERAARSGDPREEALAGARGPEGKEREADGEGAAGQRSEVVDAEERGFALERPPSLELVHESRELKQPPCCRGGAPEREGPEEDLELPARAQEERDGEREHRVLDELRRRHEVRQEPVVGRPRKRVDRRRD